MAGKEYIFKGKLFSDCTGDGEVGFLAGADFRMGREVYKSQVLPVLLRIADGRTSLHCQQAGLPVKNSLSKI